MIFNLNLSTLDLCIETICCGKYFSCISAAVSVRWVIFLELRAIE